MFVYPCRAHDRDAAVLVFEVAFRDQARDVQVAVVVLAQQRHAVRLRLLVVVADPRIDADDRLDARTQCRAGKLDHREQIALIGQRDRRHVHPGDRLHQRLDPHNTVDQRVFGVEAQVDVGGIGQTQTPYRGVAVRRSVYHLPGDEWRGTR